MELFLMTGAVARLINRSEQAVRLYAESGRLPSLKTENGRRLFKRRDVELLAIELSKGDSDKPQAALR